MRIGCDIEDVERWRQSRRLEDLFTADELVYARARSDAEATLAGLWCAREATYKALAVDHPSLGIRSLAVTHDADGRPRMICSDPTLADAVASVDISISHSATTAMAVAVAP